MARASDPNVQEAVYARGLYDRLRMRQGIGQRRSIEQEFLRSRAEMDGAPDLVAKWARLSGITRFLRGTAPAYLPGCHVKMQPMHTICRRITADFLEAARDFQGLATPSAEAWDVATPAV